MYNKFLEKHILPYNEIKSNIDLMVVWMGYIYDINFKQSYIIIHEKGYMSKIVDRVDYKDKETKEKMKEIEKYANKYIEEKIKKDD